MSSVKDASELDHQKMKEITELLNVTELRDILSINKVRPHFLTDVCSVYWKCWMSQYVILSLVCLQYVGGPGVQLRLKKERPY